MKNFSFTLIAVVILSGCLTKKKTHQIIDPAPRIEDLKPGPINLELAAALDHVLSSNSDLVAVAPCPGEMLNELTPEQIKTYQCGAIKVPELHHEKTNRSMALSFVRISKDFNTKKQLLVIEQGGPGMSSMLLADAYLSHMPELLNDFDILAVEQRGTRWTRPAITCDEFIEYRLKTLNEPSNRLRDKELLKSCFERVTKNLDINAITTYQIASDIDFAARQFGYSTFHFYGVSYGTLVGHYLLKYYPDSLQQTILDSPVVPGYDWSPDAMGNIDDVFSKNLQSFISEREKEGSWYLNFDETLSYLNELSSEFSKPVMVDYTYENKEYPLAITAERYLEYIFRIIAINKDFLAADYLIQAAKELESDPQTSRTIFSILATSIEDVEDDLSSIMYQSLICREFEISDNNLKKFKNAKSLKTLFGEKTFNKALAESSEDQRCSLGLTKNENPFLITGPLSTNKPVLVVGGEVDHVTDPRYVAKVATNFTNGHQAVFKGAGHGVFMVKDCTKKSLIGFLKNTDQNRFINHCE